MNEQAQSFNIEINLNLKGPNGVNTRVAQIYHGEISSPDAAIRCGRDSLDALEHSIDREVTKLAELEQAERQAEMEQAAQEAVNAMANGTMTQLPPNFMPFMEAQEFPHYGHPFVGMDGGDAGFVMMDLGRFLGLGEVSPVPAQRLMRSIPADLDHPLAQSMKRHPGFKVRPDQIIPKGDDIKVTPPQFDLGEDNRPRDGYPDTLKNMPGYMGREEFAQEQRKLKANPGAQPIVDEFKNLGWTPQRPADLTRSDEDMVPQPQIVFDNPGDLTPPLKSIDLELKASAAPFAEGGPDVAPAGSLAPEAAECTRNVGCPLHAPDGGNHPVRAGE